MHVPPPRTRPPLAPVAALCAIVFAMLTSLGAAPVADVAPASAVSLDMAVR